MQDLFIYLFAFFVLFVVIILLFWDRWSIIDRSEKEKDRLLDEMAKLQAALIAKNANEYTMMRTMDNVVAKEKKVAPPPEYVDESELDDDEFFDTIEKRRKLDEK